MSLAVALWLRVLDVTRWRSADLLAWTACRLIVLSEWIEEWAEEMLRCADEMDPYWSERKRSPRL